MWRFYSHGKNVPENFETFIVVVKIGTSFSSIQHRKRCCVQLNNKLKETLSMAAKICKKSQFIESVLLSEAQLDEIVYFCC